MAEIVTGFVIHLIIPLAGLLYFLKIRKQMSLEKIPNPPETELFVVFATYGGLLILILTAFFWKWSGAASLGFLYLILGAPILILIKGKSLYNARETSKYHMWVYNSSIYYFLITPTTFIALFIIFL